jgi:hypothetical protein
MCIFQCLTPEMQATDIIPTQAEQAPPGKTPQKRAPDRFPYERLCVCPAEGWLAAKG